MSDLTVAASTPEEVVRVVREAAHFGLSCRRPRACDHLHLDLRPMRQLRFYQPGDLTVGADAGMTVASLDRILAEHHQFVPLDVPDPESTTLGAVLAQRLSGPLRHRFGTVRDFTIGLEMVSAEAKLVRAGGRVVKNVAGYDWIKLAIGSRGALGILTGVHFKVFPRPLPGFTAVFAPLDAEGCARLRRALLHSPLRPLAVEACGEALHVRCSATPAVLLRYRAELEAMLPGQVRFLGDQAAAAALASRPAAVAATAAAPASAPVQTLMQRLKRELDPHGIMHGDDCAR